MRIGLQAAHDPPLERSEQLPPRKGITIDRRAGGRLVGGEQVFVVADSTDGTCAAEPPCPGAQPSEVFKWVTEVSKFPVEHGRQPVRADHQVPEPEVAMHEHHSRWRRPVLLEPAEREFEGRRDQRQLVDGLSPLREFVDVLEMGEVGASELVGRDRVESAEGGAGVGGEPSSSLCVLVVALDPAGDRFAVHGSTDEPARSDATVGMALVRGDDFGNRHLRLGRDSHDRRLGGHPALVTQLHAALSLENEPFVVSVDRDPEAV
ncbi:MAG: hypothetical protein R2710_30285, partial [Acidimicrobiales bacterium]